MTETKTMWVDISTVKGNPKNPRVIKDANFKRLVDKIRKFPKMMDKRELVVITKGGGYEVLGGNQRLRALQELGWKQVPIKLADDFTEDERAQFIITDNISDGDWEWDILQTEWKEFPLEEWGLTVPDWRTATEDGYEAPPLDDVKTDIVRGDLIEIGTHRLLCGDSTVKADVDRLMGGAKPFLMVTDPPYGVNYDANWRNEADRANGKPYGASAIGKVSNDDISSWKDAYALSPSSVAYVWHASASAIQFALDLMECKFEIRAQIIWVKNNIVISRGHYHWKHEPCWYAVRKGSKANWIGDRSQSTAWEIDKPMKSETGHSTQKPVECMGRPIRNHDSKEVYDPFLGSGTTMVACQQLERIAYCCEIEPRYCQVTIDRMLKLNPDLEVKITHA